MAMHRNFSEGIGFFVRKNIEDMVGKYGIDAEKAESRYYIYTAMAEMAYMLSCCHEEGKLLVCKMAYADSRNDSIKDILISNGEYLEFREPFEFRIDVLEKMTLSAGGGNTYIVVSGDSPDELKILGLYTFNNDLGQIWHRAQMEGNMGNLPVNIRIKKPGVISFCLGPVEMLEFEHNNVYREKPLDRMVGSAVFKAKLFGDSSRVLQYAEDALDGDLSIPVVS
ncbi:MAG: hypothetical protein IJ863_03445, partial [Spirochaetales bacterium]|nr:hypothetical protein [Spirochaetales bacterium]